MRLLTLVFKSSCRRILTFTQKSDRSILQVLCCLCSDLAVGEERGKLLSVNKAVADQIILRQLDLHLLHRRLRYMVFWNGALCHWATCVFNSLGSAATFLFLPISPLTGSVRIIWPSHQVKSSASQQKDGCRAETSKREPNR